MKRLVHLFLMIAAAGCATLPPGVANDEIRGTIARLGDIPVDIAPVFVGAGE